MYTLYIYIYNTCNRDTNLPRYLPCIHHPPRSGVPFIMKAGKGARVPWWDLKYWMLIMTVIDAKFLGIYIYSSIVFGFVDVSWSFSLNYILRNKHQ